MFSSSMVKCQQVYVEAAYGEITLKAILTNTPTLSVHSTAFAVYVCLY